MGINKLYLFQHKALEDNILTSDEILECRKIIEETNEKINKIKYGNNIEIERSNGRSPALSSREAKEVKKDLIQKKKLLKLEYNKKLKNL